jgi:hypothetical protein
VKTRSIFSNLWCLALVAPLALVGCGGDEDSGNNPGPDVDGGNSDALAQDGGAGPDGTEGEDAQPDGSSSIPDGGLPSDPMTIQCGLDPCTTPAEQCCVVQSDAGASASCESAGTACPGINIGCDEAADCPSGQVCCGEVSFGSDGPTLKSTCAASCTGLTRRQLCRTNTECGSEACEVTPCQGIPLEVCGGIPDALKALCE